MGKMNKLTRKVQSHLNPDEKIISIVMGVYETKILGNESVRRGIFVATNKRLVFYAKKITGYDLEDFPFSKISSIELGKNMMGHILSFFVSGNKVTMKWINKGDIKKFVEYVRSQIGNDSSKIEVPNNDIPQQIEKLSKLKNQGILTEVEFQNKKEELLSRL